MTVSRKIWIWGPTTYVLSPLNKLISRYCGGIYVWLQLSPWVWFLHCLEEVSPYFTRASLPWVPQLPLTVLSWSGSVCSVSQHLLMIGTWPHHLTCWRDNVSCIAASLSQCSAVSVRLGLHFNHAFGYSLLCTSHFSCSIIVCREGGCSCLESRWHAPSFCLTFSFSYWLSR